MTGERTMSERAMSTRNRGFGEVGFSLIELMVAMVVTLIVSGAIYGLLAGGQNAFRREPELSDRQQNIRVAMDLIRSDVLGAGSGMVPFVQAFTDGLDGTGPAPAVGQATGASGNPTDVLEILTNDGTCQDVALATAPAAAAGPYVSNERLPACFPDNTRTGFVYVGAGAADRISYGVVLATADSPTGTAPFQLLPIDPVAAAVNPLAGFCGDVPGGGVPSPTCTRAVAMSVVRYVIARDPAEPTVPCLWRSASGQFDSAGTVVATPPGGNWQMVARGIEDLQIRYWTGVSGSFVDAPGVVACTAPCAVPTLAELNTIVREVQVTLFSRALAPNLAGQTLAPGAPNAVRGQLTTTVSPRAALQARNLIPPGSLTPDWF